MLLHAPQSGVPTSPEGPGPVPATNLMASANQHRGGRAHLESLQVDLGQDQGFSSMKKTSETRAAIHFLPSPTEGSAFAFFLPPCRTKKKLKQPEGLAGSNRLWKVQDFISLAVDRQGDGGVK